MGSNQAFGQKNDDTKIAFLADVHLQDVYADLGKGEFKGIYHPQTDKYATIRTMKAQINSTRLFNENYFAFHEALKKVVAQGIKIVVLPGDFSDDGQPMNLKALNSILSEFSEAYGLRFYLTTGNHDPVTATRSPGGKYDFMGPGGKPQALVSDTSYLRHRLPADLPVAFSDQIAYGGYLDVLEELGAFGFYPSEEDVFWTHPFEALDYEAYSFQKAEKNAVLANRYFDASAADSLPDLSYLVEPVEGIWLLGIDANVYFPAGGTGIFKGSSVGFNLAKDHKSHQLQWINEIATEAEERGKTLISFSHYPLVEFNDGSDDLLKKTFGPNKFQLARSPLPSISTAYADAGIKVHVAGHMHINDTGIFTSENDNTLVNVQVPSLAAYPPAFKVLTFGQPGKIEVATHRLRDVQRMDEFFPLYKMEHDYLTKQHDPAIWKEDILSAPTYLDYTSHHLSELVRLRFIPSDWPEQHTAQLLALNGLELAYWASLENSDLRNDFLTDRSLPSKALKQLSKNLKQQRIRKSWLVNMSGQELITTFYFVKNGDQLAQDDMDRDRWKAAEHLMQTIGELTPGQNESFAHFMVNFAKIFTAMAKDTPSDHFMIDLKEGTVESL
ncbi:metallophosphoesterase family protein [Echinicola strongylocentroti]|uniref:metallophosphoesterase family protein n=1 Tax=Echinicola strongylocentroti TaxID=1795355 RepID=UPI001FE9CBBB|nr:metallophosphoesterase [Echinicola strongylocentroti]